MHKPSLQSARRFLRASPLLLSRPLTSPPRRISGETGPTLITQEDGEAGVRKVFELCQHSGRLAPLRGLAPPTLLQRASRAARTSLEHLLPKDYRTSVGSTYLGYVKWTMAASTAGTVSGVLSMQALLYAVGLGSGSIPTAAALNWVLKDGLGQLGGVMFASMINQRFDAEPKRWRFKSAAVLDASLLLEVLTPLFPNHFLLFASVANIGKNVGWLSASATRAGIHRSFMRVENLADITGKAGSQSIASSVVGTGLGIGLSSMIGQSTTGILGATVLLSVIHLTCTYQAMHTVTIRTLNLQRLWIAIRPCLVYSFDKNGELERIGIDSSKVLSPEEVAPGETFIHWGHLSARRHGHSILEQDKSETDLEGFASNEVRIRVGSDIDRAFPRAYLLTTALDRVLSLGDSHLLSVTEEPKSYWDSSMGPVLHVLFLENGSPKSSILAMVHTMLTHQYLTYSALGCQNIAPESAREWISEDNFHALLSVLQQRGWELESTFFEPFRSRISFKFDHSN